MSKSAEQNNFYWSNKWKRLRNYVMEKYNYICQHCGGTAKIVHHIEWIDENNLNDVNVTLNEDNLIPLCQECHNRVHNHQGMVQDNLMFNDEGDLVQIMEEKSPHQF